MKTQTLKSLSLRKRTIANLNNFQMDLVKGGLTCSGCRTVDSECKCPYTIKEESCTCPITR